MTFLEISTNIPKQFSRLCGIRLSGLVNILKNKSASPPPPPPQPKLKHVIVLHFRSNIATLKKINCTLLKPFDNQIVTLHNYNNFELKWHHLYIDGSPFFSLFFNYLKYSVTYIKIKLLLIHSSYNYYSYGLIN